jgi:hypothetical protein
MPIVGLERVVFYREQGSSMYDAWAFGLVASSVELPYILVQVCVLLGAHCIPSNTMQHVGHAGSKKLMCGCVVWLWCLCGEVGWGGVGDHMPRIPVHKLPVLLSCASHALPRGHAPRRRAPLPWRPDTCLLHVMSVHMLLILRYT